MFLFVKAASNCLFLFFTRMYPVALFFALCAVSHAMLFDMTMDEIKKAEGLLAGIDMAVDRLNSRHDRKEYQLRYR